jgi:hypothetical protein
MLKGSPEYDTDIDLTFKKSSKGYKSIKRICMERIHKTQKKSWFRCIT